MAAAIVAVLTLVLAIALDQPSARPTAGRPAVGVVALVLATAPLNDPYHGQLCGGVLVAPDTVLTAAHCVTGFTPHSFEVIVLADNLCRGAPIDGARLGVVAIARHPAYNPATGRFDLAALTLASPAGGGRRADPRQGSVGMRVTAYGWGAAGEGLGRSCRLGRLRLRVLDDAGCQAALGIGRHVFDAATMVCAEPESESAGICHWDSGGPLVTGADEDQQSAVIGIASWGRTCEGPTVFARALWPW